MTYFDPFTESRVDGLDALQVRFAPMKTMKVPFTSPRYEMITPKVQRSGDLATLTVNLVNYGRLPDAPEQVLALECEADLQSNWRHVEDHPQPLVVPSGERSVNE